jgi:hypothetical protein
MTHMVRMVPALIMCATVAVLGSHIVTPLPIAAESASGGLPFTIDWASAFSTLGVGSILCWYLYYTTSVAFPRVRADFRDEMEAERKHHQVLADKATERVEKVCAELSTLNAALIQRPCLMNQQRAAPS